MVNNDPPSSRSGLDIENINILFSDQDTSKGWNIINYNKIEKLQIILKNLENAHRECRDLNRTLNKLIQIPMLLFSSLMTVFITYNNNDNNLKKEITSYHLNIIYWIEFCLTLLVTILSGMNTYFTNGIDAETHHTVSRKYYKMRSQLKIDMETRNHTFIELYKNYIDNISNTREASISLFPFIRKRNNIEDDYNI